MRRRPRSVSKKILLLVLVPMLSLFGLYVFTTALAGRDVISLHRAQVLKSATSAPVGNFLGQLGIERVAAVVYLAAPTQASQAQLAAQEARTNRTAAGLRRALDSPNTSSNSSAAGRQANLTLLKAVAGLPRLRAQIAARSVTRQQAMAAYHTVAMDAYGLLGQVILQEPNASIVSQALALVRMGKVEELLQQENAILTGDLVARSFPAADAHQFTELSGARQVLFGQTLSDLSPAYRTYYTHDITPPAVASLISQENAVISGAPAGHARGTGTAGSARLPAVNPTTWQQAVRAFSAGLEQAGAQASTALGNQALGDSRITELRLALAGGLGLLAVAASILISLLVGRGLVRELTGLRQAALDLADRRLPAVVHSLAAGQHVEVPTDDLAIDARSDEVREVAGALAKVRQTAIEAAVGQARLREGMSEVFRKLARRSQSLLHRQLTLLDSMERRARDPHLLEDLFRADHLTTRMRRNAENLIILSGQEPARGWRHPVPLVDVLRGAIAEVEDYTRIRVVCSASASLAGRAVGDVIHLLAELAENATAFSPPNTPVTMSGDVVGQGFAVEIEDRGLGMSPEKLAEVNDRLAEPPAFDPASADQLGLFVAAQLAKRHDIRIHLRPNPYGGTTAIVLIPRTLVAPPDADDRPADVGQAMGRHATRGDGGGTLEPLPPEPGPLADRLPPDSDPLTDPMLPQPRRPDPLGTVSTDPLSTGSLGAAGTGSLGTGGTGSLGTAAPAAIPEPAAPAAFGEGLDTGRPDLPRRVRQASLVEQLRANAPLSAPLPDESLSAPRSPEDARTTMAAMQHGWQRGRSMFDPAPPRGEDGGSDEDS